jgi:hypothetical protein
MREFSKFSNFPLILFLNEYIQEKHAGELTKCLSDRVSLYITFLRNTYRKRNLSNIYLFIKITYKKKYSFYIHETPYICDFKEEYYPKDTRNTRQNRHKNF